MVPYVARWDLDKTYLRTEFSTLRDLLKTAFERAEQKRTVPGASTLLREIAATGASVHILSGSPEQLRAKLEEKLRLDGARWDSFTLKPNLRNVLRLRFRAVRDQLGYKLPALLAARAKLPAQRSPEGHLLKEVLIGDDAESDALVYALYADVIAGVVGDTELEEILTRVDAYKDAIADAIRYARIIDHGDAVDRILIHLDRNSPPSDFAPYGPLVVPFYNYLQAAFVLEEDGRLPPAAVVRVAIDLVLDHRFDGEALGRSYLDLWRRGHLKGTGALGIGNAFREMAEVAPLPAAREIGEMCKRLEEAAHGISRGEVPPAKRDYVALLDRHVRRRGAIE
jgi:Phosphatidate phosphatase APP1, catalytic domain